MSVEFAEKILSSMVDENGNCGERARSMKQFEILTSCHDVKMYKREDMGCWRGHYGVRHFEMYSYSGNVGKYYVEFHEYAHFHSRYVIESISLRPEAEVEKERKLAQLAKFDNSEWQFEPKKRVDISLCLVRESSYDISSYSGYGVDTVHIYTFADEDGNCYVWKTQSFLGLEREDEEGLVKKDYQEIGDVVTVKATVKEHSEFRGVKQTVLTRVKVNDIQAA